MVLAAKPKKPDSIHHKKRTGHHHKQSKHYAKAYLPYLPMLAIIGLGFVLNSLWPQPGGGVLAYATSMSANDLLQETNEERQTAGQSTLTINSRLSNAAQAKANDMAQRGYWSHVTPEGVEPWHFVRGAGYDYQAAGENLAYGFLTSAATVTGWMNSPGHRANILNSGYQEVGFGIANAGNYQGNGPETIVVAMYGTPATATETAILPQSADIGQPAPSPTPVAEVPTPASLQIIRSTDSAPAAGTSSDAPAVAGTSRSVTRLELISNVSPANVVILTLILAAAAGILILRHIIFWRHALVRGELFIIRHWKADLAITGLIVIGALITRTAGTIL
jgi:uncharacterized protein YkwD